MSGDHVAAVKLCDAFKTAYGQGLHSSTVSTMCCMDLFTIMSGFDASKLDTTVCKNVYSAMKLIDDPNDAEVIAIRRYRSAVSPPRFAANPFLQ